MQSVFSRCSSLETLDLSGWDTSNVHDASRLFTECRSLKSLDLSKWNTKNLGGMSTPFDFCESLNELRTGEGWTLESINKYYTPIFNKDMYDENGTLHSKNTAIPKGAHIYTSSKPDMVIGANAAM